MAMMRSRKRPLGNTRIQSPWLHDRGSYLTTGVLPAIQVELLLIWIKSCGGGLVAMYVTGQTDPESS